MLSKNKGTVLGLPGTTGDRTLGQNLYAKTNGGYRVEAYDISSMTVTQARLEPDSA